MPRKSPRSQLSKSCVYSGSWSFCPRGRLTWPLTIATLCIALAQFCRQHILAGPAFVIVLPECCLDAARIHPQPYINFVATHQRQSKKLHVAIPRRRQRQKGRRQPAKHTLNSGEPATAPADSHPSRTRPGPVQIAIPSSSNTRPSIPVPTASIHGSTASSNSHGGAAAPSARHG